MQELLNESLERRGGTRNVPTGGSSSDEVAKIWFSGYYKWQKFPKKSLFTFQRGASMLRRGAIAPIALPWRHPCLKGTGFLVVDACRYKNLSNRKVH